MPYAIADLLNTGSTTLIAVVTMLTTVDTHDVVPGTDIVDCSSLPLSDVDVEADRLCAIVDFLNSRDMIKVL